MQTVSRHIHTPHSPNTTSSKLRHTIFVLALAVAAALIYLHDISVRPLWADESITLLRAGGTSRKAARALLEDGRWHDKSEIIPYQLVKGRAPLTEQLIGIWSQPREIIFNS